MKRQNKEPLPHTSKKSPPPSKSSSTSSSSKQSVVSNKSQTQSTSRATLSSIGTGGTSSGKTIIPDSDTDLREELENLIAHTEIIVFSKGNCLFCRQAKDLLTSLSAEYKTVELDNLDNGPEYQSVLTDITGQRTVPNIFLYGSHLGGFYELNGAKETGKLQKALKSKMAPINYDNDVVVIGGGSGGLAAAKEAAQLGKKVTLFDFVKPSPQGSTWGIGGTCVNVGCIPKKLMHRGAILGESLHDAKEFGWNLDEKMKHDWQKMRDAIQDHIGSLNWGYRVQLRDMKVNYVNAYAEIIDPHTIKAVKKNKQEITVTTENIIIATGERPKYLDIPGAKEFCITSDDLFSLPYNPGKTLCVGASYVSLECAGFLAGIGLDTTVMVRSILLRGFDQQCAEMIGSYMEKHGVKFIRGAVPIKIEQVDKGTPGRYKVTSKTNDGKEIVDEYNTVLLAVGRDPCTSGIGLENVKVNLNKSNNRVVVNEKEQTNLSNIFAIGDIGDGRPQLTPVAIHAGKLLSRRLFVGSKEMVDYNNIATTVFTPLEYGCIGYSEEKAIEALGKDNIEVYHSYFQPLEWTVAHRQENTCYAKLVCDRSNQDKVIGFHVLGPNAGEITQGYAVAMRLGAKKHDFDSTIGIHPTCSETFTLLHVTKRSGKSPEVTGC